MMRKVRWERRLSLKGILEQKNKKLAEAKMKFSKNLPAGGRGR
jgi:hypothetical protein